MYYRHGEGKDALKLFYKSHSFHITVYVSIVARHVSVHPWVRVYLFLHMKWSFLAENGPKSEICIHFHVLSLLKNGCVLLLWHVFLLGHIQ